MITTHPQYFFGTESLKSSVLRVLPWSVSRIPMFQPERFLFEASFKQKGFIQQKGELGKPHPVQNSQCCAPSLYRICETALLHPVVKLGWHFLEALQFPPPELRQRDTTCASGRGKAALPALQITAPSQNTWGQIFTLHGAVPWEGVGGATEQEILQQRTRVVSLTYRTHVSVHHDGCSTHFWDPQSHKIFLPVSVWMCTVMHSCFYGIPGCS